MLALISQLKPRELSRFIFVKSEYSLTESGLEQMDAVRSIKEWALKWKINNVACASQSCRVCVGNDCTPPILWGSIMFIRIAQFGIE